jgi:5-methylthioadenosine/S-adenosylhomocysteine deaminase
MKNILFKLRKTALLTFLLFHLLSIAGYSQAQPGLLTPAGTIVLKGTIITPDSIIPNGWIFIENHKISSIHNSIQRNEIPENAIYIDTKGIIFPGLIDLHNHVTWNVFPQWNIGKQRFSNRYEWRYHNLEYQKKVAKPNDKMLYSGVSFFCQMNTYGELRALVGGTTSILNTSDDENDCIRGLVRNLDDPTQLDLQRIDYYIDIQNHNPDKPENTQKINNELEAIRQKLISGNLDAFLIHLAEGKANDSITKQEFSILQDKGLLTNKTAIIHGIALGPIQFQAMYDKGASLIWSPRSNIELYGQTTDIISAKNKKVRIALAPDWAITGSKNMLDELGYAADWNKKHLNSIFSDKDLVEMVTSIPAGIAGISDKVGSIKVGLYADLLVISGDISKPYSSLVQAGTEDVKLVFINGIPIYGRKELMEKLWHKSLLEQLTASPPMMLRLPLPINSMGTFEDLERSLSLKLSLEGSALAPLFPTRKPPTDNEPKILRVESEIKGKPRPRERN